MRKVLELNFSLLNQKRDGPRKTDLRFIGISILNFAKSRSFLLTLFISATTVSYKIMLSSSNHFLYEFHHVVSESGHEKTSAEKVKAKVHETVFGVNKSPRLGEVVLKFTLN